MPYYLPIGGAEKDGFVPFANNLDENLKTITVAISTPKLFFVISPQVTLVYLF